MCFQFRPPDPLPEPPGVDALAGDVLDLAIAWSDVHLNGKLALPEARAMVRFEIEKLNAIRAAMESGL